MEQSSEVTEDPHNAHAERGLEYGRTTEHAVMDDAATAALTHHTDRAEAADGPRSESEVQRALFSRLPENAAPQTPVSSTGGDGVDEDANLDAYERFAVEDVLPASRRGSRTASRVQSTVAPDRRAADGSGVDIDAHGADEEDTELPVEEAATASAGANALSDAPMEVVAAVVEAPVRPLHFAPYPPQPHTAAFRAEAQPPPGPSDHWNEVDWLLPPSLTPTDRMPSYMTVGTGSGGNSEPQSFHPRGSRGGDRDHDDELDADSYPSLPPSWMRPTLEDVRLQGAVPPLAVYEPRGHVNAAAPATATATTTETATTATEVVASSSAAARDDPFSDPADPSVGVIIAPSAPADDAYSNFSSRDASTTLRAGTAHPDWPDADVPSDAEAPMTTIEVGGGQFGTPDAPPLPPTTLNGGNVITFGRHAVHTPDHDEEVVSPSEYFRRGLRTTAVESNERAQQQQQQHGTADDGRDSAMRPQADDEGSSDHAPTITTTTTTTRATSGSPADELSPVTSSTRAGSDVDGTREAGTAPAAGSVAQSPTSPALRARQGSSSASRPRVTFRDEVEEFSAPRPASTTEEEDDGHDFDRRRRHGADVAVEVAASSSSPWSSFGPREPPPPASLSPDELQEMRLRSFMEAARPREDVATAAMTASTDALLTGKVGPSTSPATTGSSVSDAPEENVSTLDFLKETSNVILPDFMNAMFASTSDFLARSKEKVAGAVPEPLKKAADRTQHGMSMVLDFTSDVIGGAPTYVARAIPSSVMSDETKKLVFVDFASVMRCCVNANLLVVPFIFRVTGLVGATVVMAFVAVVNGYCTEAFFAAKHQLRDAAYVVTYGDVPRLTWGRWSTGFSMAYATLFLIAFTAYAAANASVLLEVMGMPNGGGATALSVIIPPLCSFPFVMCKRAKSVSRMSSLTTLLILAAVVLLFVALPYKAVKSNTHALGPNTVTDFFVGLNIAIYVFTPVSLAVPVERTMTPRRFKHLLRVGLLFEYLLAVAFGLCAYLSLTSNTCSVLPVSIHRQMAVTIFMHNVDAGLSAVLFFALLWFIPRLFFNIGELCDQRVLGLRTIPSYWQFKPNLVRFLYLALVSLAAYVVPYFGIWMALAGALGCGVAGILIPAALDYVRRERLGFLRGRLPRWWELVLVFSVIFFGLVVVGVGGVLSTFAMWAVVQAGAITTC